MNTTTTLAAAILTLSTVAIPAFAGTSRILSAYEGTYLKGAECEARNANELLVEFNSLSRKLTLTPQKNGVRAGIVDEFFRVNAPAMVGPWDNERSRMTVENGVVTVISEVKSCEFFGISCDDEYRTLGPAIQFREVGHTQYVGNQGSDCEYYRDLN